MMRKVKRILIALGIICIFINFYWIILEITSEVGRNDIVATTTAKHRTSSRIASKTTPKEFVYLVQTESCLPVYLAGPELLGDTSACRCDVLVLSYKKKCEEINKHHIQYIHAPNTTWASGRNLLFRRSTERQLNYRYYVFADDDIRLEYNALANTSIVNSKQSQLRTYENFLLDIEPAVGFVNYIVHHPASFMRLIRQHCLNKPDLSLLPLVHFDPIINGFHRDAISHLLPYSEEFDSVCWWHANRLVSIAIEAKFRGQAVMYPGITVVNLSHRKYPTNNTDEIQVMKDGIEREKARTPQQYRDHFIFFSYYQSPDHYSFGFSPTTCMDVVRHRPIIPYAHFEEFPLRDYKTLDDIFNMTSLYPAYLEEFKHDQERTY